MLNILYLKLIWRLYRGLIIFAALFIGFIQFIIIWVFSKINYAPILETILDQLPPQMQMLFNDQFMNQLSLQGAAAFGFNHPLVLFLLALVVILIASRQIAGESENSLLELILSYPFPRQNFYLSLWSSLLLILLIIVTTGFLGSFLAFTIIKAVSKTLVFSLIKIALNLWLLFSVITSYSLFLSAMSRESSRAGTFSAAITLVFYLLFFLGNLWDSLAVIQPFNIFNYYQPQKLMFDQVSFFSNSILLMSITLLLFTGGMIYFLKRDIP